MPELQLFEAAEVDGLRLTMWSRGAGPRSSSCTGWVASRNLATQHRRASPAARRSTPSDLPGRRFGQARVRATAREFLPARWRGFMDGLGLGAGVAGGPLARRRRLRHVRLMHPSRVERLALVGARGSAAAIGRRGFRFVRSRARRARLERGVGRALQGVPDSVLPRADRARSTSSSTIATRPYGAGRARAYLTTLRDVADRSGGARARLSPRDGHAQLPVLLITAAGLRRTGRSHCDEVASVVSHAAVRRVDACGHFPQIDTRRR